MSFSEDTLETYRALAQPILEQLLQQARLLARRESKKSSRKRKLAEAEINSDETDQQKKVKALKRAEHDEERWHELSQLDDGQLCAFLASMLEQEKVESQMLSCVSRLTLV